ncbi:hypothetical protein KM1_034650 [Entamoeba histolytica HM-3:IMSS]|uniref:Uncharacterized protein n=2 Tax=Entamoeba histolytica TaxID=5759 RepID=A0A175JM72_ENTHI|nr:hypothetical protein KM1_034650 [Entamoeba histolytica HM-3:IMSS]GAT94737.1 hypothetical protein CL6EHI_c00089 [Entamoeba histolytica]
MVVKKESRGGNGILDIIEEITPCTEDDNRNDDHHHPRLLQQDSEGDGILEIDDGVDFVFSKNEIEMDFSI